MTDIKKIFDEAGPPLLPQSEFKDWAYDKSLRQILDECEREDWLLWLLSKVLGTEDRLFIYLKAKLADIIRDVLSDTVLLSAIDAGLLYGNGLIVYAAYNEKKEEASNYQKYLSLNAVNSEYPTYLQYTIQSMAARWIYDDQGYSVYRMAIELLNEVDQTYPIFNVTIQPRMIEIIKENTKHLN